MEGNEKERKVIEKSMGGKGEKRDDEKIERGKKILVDKNGTDTEREEDKKRKRTV